MWSWMQTVWCKQNYLISAAELICPASAFCTTPYLNPAEDLLLVWKLLIREPPAALCRCERQTVEKVWTQCSRDPPKGTSKISSKRGQSFQLSRIREWCSTVMEVPNQGIVVLISQTRCCRGNHLFSLLHHSFFLFFSFLRCHQQCWAEGAVTVEWKPKQVSLHINLFHWLQT